MNEFSSKFSNSKVYKLLIWFNKMNNLEFIIFNVNVKIIDTSMTIQSYFDKKIVVNN